MPRPTSDIVRDLRAFVGTDLDDPFAVLLNEAADRLEKASTIPDVKMPWDMSPGITWLRDKIADGSIDDAH